MSPEQVIEHIRSDDQHHPRTSAVTFEDTHNRHGGVAWSLAELRAASDAAHERGLTVHLDGARIFNAAVATGTEVRDIAACADTLTFCLSKGLGAPAGSVFCGPADKVAEAVRWRKMLGGGMREIGMLAAAGLVALETMVDRLADDHTNARTLAEGLAELPGVTIDLDRVQTNLVIFELDSMAPERFLAECSARGLKGGGMGGRKVRFVTRHGIAPDDISYALGVCSEVLSAN
jgi:threonine aldolase